jgi:hypothetical protein
VVRWGIGGSPLVESELNIAIEEGQARVDLNILQRGVNGKHIGHDPRAQEGLELE